MKPAGYIDTEFWGLAPQPTSYELAQTARDFGDCMDLIEAMGWPTDYELSHPTVVARRDGEIVGMLGSRRPNGLMLAGPLAVLEPPKPLMVWRLIRAYEQACLDEGIDFVLFDVDAGSTMERAVLKMWPDIPLVGDRGDVRAYRWDFDA